MDAPSALRRVVIGLGATVVLVGSTVTSAAPILSGPHYFPATGTALYPVAVADFNGDRHPDIVVGSQLNHTVSILYGANGGGFKPPRDHSGGDEPSDISIGDFNHDHRPDIAVGSYSNPGTVTVLLSRHGGFRAPVGYLVGDYVRATVVSDFDRDGNLDIAATGDSNDISVLLGRHDGTFEQGDTRPGGGVPLDLVAADFDHNGRPDLAELDFGVGHAFVRVFLGRGDGTFKAPRSFDAGATSPHGMVAGRFAGDGSLDLVVADCSTSPPNKVHILTGTGKATFSKPHGFANYPSSCTYVPAAVDLNHDGRKDVVTGTYAGANKGDISVLFGRGRGKLSPPHLFPATGSGSTNSAIAVGRFNADAAPDLVVPDYIDPRVAILYGKR